MSYAADATGALADIKAAGTALTFVRRGSVSIDPTTGVTIRGAETSYTAYALILRPQSLRMAAISLEQQTLIQNTQRRLLLAAKGLAVTPEPMDEVTFSGERWVVEHVTPLDLDVSGTPILYSVGVKQR